VCGVCVVCVWCVCGVCVCGVCVVCVCVVCVERERVCVCVYLYFLSFCTFACLCVKNKGLACIKLQ